MSQATTTTDHDEIRRWAEERGGRPSMVRTGRGRGGILRFDFGEDDEKLEETSWDEFFRIFDDNNLALLHQDQVGSGGTSRFFKFVARGARSGSKRSAGQGSRKAAASKRTAGSRRASSAGSKAARESGKVASKSGGRAAAKKAPAKGRASAGTKGGAKTAAKRSTAQRAGATSAKGGSRTAAKTGAKRTAGKAQRSSGARK